MTSPAKVPTGAIPAAANSRTALAPSVSDQRRAHGEPVEGASAVSIIPRKGPHSAATLAPETSPQAPGVDLVCVQLSQMIGLDLEDARDADLEREDIAEACGVSVARVNKWAAPSKPDHLPPLQFLPLWVKATKSQRVIDWAAQECGLTVVDADVLRDAELGRKIREAAAAVLAEVAA